MSRAKFLLMATLMGILLVIQMAYGASFTITIPNGKINDLINAFAVRFSYQEMVANPDYDPEDPEAEEMIPNPQTKIQFAKGHIKRAIKDVYREYMTNLMSEEGRVAGLEQAETDMENVTIE